MGTSSIWRFTLVTVALLLDPIFADIMVQPGYGKAGTGTQNSVGQSQSVQNQPMVQQQQQYSGNQNPSMQFLQQQHALQRQYLQQQHQQQQQQLLGLQHHELQHAAINSSPGNEVVGNPYGVPTLLPGIGSLTNGLLFSLGPLGLNSLGLGGLRRIGHPLLLAPSPYQQPQMAESTPSKLSDESKTRARREIRDSGESKRYRGKQSRPQQDGVANPTVKSKSEAAPPNAKFVKPNEDIVGDGHQEDNEDVGSPVGGLLDPLGLMDKAETLIDDLRTGQLPNPMDMLNRGGGGGGFLPGLPSWLNSANPMSNPNGNQPMLGQQQQYNQYQMQGLNDQYMMNQQRSQSQQSSGPIIGSPTHILPRPIPPRPSVPGPWGPSPYGAYGSPYGTYVPPYSSLGPWTRHSYLMSNQGPIIGAVNPAAQDQVGKMYMENSAGYQQQMTGASNPMSGSANQMAADKAGQSGTEKAGATGKSMNGGPVVGAPNPSVGAVNQAQLQAMNYPAAYYRMMAVPNQMPGYYQLARTAQPGMGMQMNPMIGSPGPVVMDGMMASNPQMVGGPNPMSDQMNGEFYDPDLQRSFDNGDPHRHHHHSNFGLDDIFDGGYGDGYNGGFNSGGYDRIYETTYHNGRPYGFGGGNNHHTHHHQSYII